MSNNLEIKVIIEQAVLSGQSGMLQRVATVYIGEEEYRAWARPEVRGNALDWLPHLIVHQFDGMDEVVVSADVRAQILGSVKRELEKRARNANRTEGLNPDGLHCDAQICLNGHVLHCDGTPFESMSHCTKCGASCIDECPICAEPIRGARVYQSSASYSRPQFCHSCGNPYPWMEDQLRTARELLEHESKLSEDDRESLWRDIQYVISDPKADLAPAKRTLVKIKLGALSSGFREFILDLMAKTGAEIIKG